MPHLTIEHSANLAESGDIGGLCETLNRAIVADPAFELGAVRVRAVACAHYAVADMVPDNAFADMVFRIGRGRTAEQKAAIGERLFEAAREHFAALFETPHFALSLEMREIDGDLSWKANAIHPRTRQLVMRKPA